MNPAIVEKQLVDLELKSGTNEAERAELIDWTKNLTTAENVVLKDIGALVKRPGTTYYGFTDDIGQLYVTMGRALPLKNGFAHVALSAADGCPRLYHLNEGSGAFSNKGRLPECSVEHLPISATQDVGGNGKGATVQSVVVSDGYVIQSVLGLPTGTSYADQLGYVYVADRNSGNVVRRFGIGNTAAYLAMASGSVVHVWTMSLNIAATVVVELWQIDLTTLTMTQITTPTVGAGNVRYIRSVKAHPSGGTVCVLDEVSDSQGRIIYAGPTGVIAYNQDAPGYSFKDMDMDAAGNMWIVGTENISTNVMFQMWDMSTGSYQSQWITAVAAGTISHLRIAVNSAGTAARVTSMNAVTATTATVPVMSVYSTDMATTFDLLGKMPCWGESSGPYYNPVAQRYYCAVSKVRLSSDFEREILSRCALVDITENIARVGALIGNSQRFRAVAMLDKYTSICTANVDFDGQYIGMFTSTKPPTIVSPDGGYTMVMPVTTKASSTTFSHSAAFIRFFDLTAYHSTPEGVISGGLVAMHDGLAPSEVGHLETANVFVQAGGAGTLAAGTRSYVAVLEYVDAKGNVHWSQCSPVSQFTNAASVSNTVRISLPSVTMRASLTHNGEVVVKLYRTISSGTQFHLLKQTSEPNSGVLSGVMYADITDDKSDDLLLLGDVLHRQPGTPNTSLDRYPPPASRHVVTHKDRTFLCSGSQVYYSGFLVDGEAPWFNPAFSILIPGGTGDITGLASMDGVLVVFKRDGIWVIDGDGPPENGGTGTEFSPPKRILTEFGCVDPRTIVSTPDGVMYRSSRGIELITRGMRVVFIGANVKDTVNANPFPGGSAFDRKTGRVFFTMGESAFYTRGQLSYISGGKVAVYDTRTGGWTISKHTTGTGTYGAPLQDVAVANISGADEVLFVDCMYYIHKEVSSHGFDLDVNYVPIKLETAWIKIKSAQDRIRVSDFLVLAKSMSNHNLKISVAYDYSNTYSYTKTWTPLELESLTLEQLELQVPQQAVQSIRFKIEDEVPADTVTYPTGTGKGPEILALSVKMGLRGGGAKLAAAQKG